jgi:hypothetical protein
LYGPGTTTANPIQKYQPSPICNPNPEAAFMKELPNLLPDFRERVAVLSFSVQRSLSLLSTTMVFAGISGHSLPVLAAPASVVLPAPAADVAMNGLFGRLNVRSFMEALIPTDQDSDTTQSEHQGIITTCGMDEAMLSLFLQSYNAGPFAVTRFGGNVPFRETRAYVPRVKRFYRMDLSDNPFDAHIVASANRHGLDPQLIRAIMKAESNFRNRTTSRAGARGLMQVMPITWNAVRRKYNISWDYHGNVFNPARNIEVACAYLAWVRYDHLPRNFASFRNPVTPPSITPPALLASASVPPSRGRSSQQAAVIQPRRFPGMVQAAAPQPSAQEPQSRRLAWNSGFRPTLALSDRATTVAQNVERPRVENNRQNRRTVTP